MQDFEGKGQNDVVQIKLKHDTCYARALTTIEHNDEAVECLKFHI